MSLENWSVEGVVRFHVGIRVGVKEFVDLSPEQIASFFGGIAQMLAAVNIASTQEATMEKPNPEPEPQDKEPEGHKPEPKDQQAP